MHTFKRAAALALAGALFLALPAAGVGSHGPAYDIHALSNSPGAPRADLPKSFAVGAKSSPGIKTAT